MIDYINLKKLKKIEICIKNVFQKKVGWLGGSYFSSRSDFISLVCTKEEYFEKGILMFKI